jgi:hypothetical protein
MRGLGIREATADGQSACQPERSVRIRVGGRCDTRVWPRPSPRSLATLGMTELDGLCAVVGWRDRRRPTREHPTGRQCLRLRLLSCYPELDAGALSLSAASARHELCRPSLRDLSGERVAEGRVRGRAIGHERARCTCRDVGRPPSSAFGTFSPRRKREGRRATMATAWTDREANRVWDCALAHSGFAIPIVSGNVSRPARATGGAR